MQSLSVQLQLLLLFKNAMSRQQRLDVIIQTLFMQSVCVCVVAAHLCIFVGMAWALYMGLFLVTYYQIFILSILSPKNGADTVYDMYFVNVLELVTYHWKSDFTQHCITFLRRW